MTSSDTDPAPQMPDKLGEGGAALWREITEAYELRPDELVLLEAACREVDLVDRLDTELAGADLLVAGSLGQDRVHPLLVEIRLHRATLAGLLKRLNLPDESPYSAERGARVSEAARKAARARWGTGGGHYSSFRSRHPAARPEEQAATRAELLAEYEELYYGDDAG